MSEVDDLEGHVDFLENEVADLHCPDVVARGEAAIEAVRGRLATDAKRIAELEAQVGRLQGLHKKHRDTTVVLYEQIDYWRELANDDPVIPGDGRRFGMVRCARLKRAEEER